MVKWLKEIIWGNSCDHEWEFIHKNEFPKILLKCTKCGKFTKKRV